MPVLIAETGPESDLEAPLPAGCLRRPCAPHDTMDVALLYFTAYPPGEAATTLEEAQADIATSFAGQYGAFWPEASPVVIRGVALVAAVLTVRRASWKTAPDCPYLTEVFTALEQHRQDLARAAVARAMAVLSAAGTRQMALTVAADHDAALALYASLGFRERQDL